MPQLTLRALKKRILELKPNPRLDYLRQQIAGRAVLKAEVKQLVVELEQRQAAVARGELPMNSVWETEQQISSRMNTINVDYEIEAMNCAVFDKDAKLIWNMLDYDKRQAREPVQKAVQLLSQLRSSMETNIASQEKAIQHERNIVRAGPWEPDPPHERLYRKMVTDLEDYRRKAEGEIRHEEKKVRSLQQAEREARYNYEFFRHWVITGSLDGPPNSPVVTEAEPVPA